MLDVRKKDWVGWVRERAPRFAEGAARVDEEDRFVAENFEIKTIAVKAAVATTESALQAVGGEGFFRALGLERLLRDASAGDFHLLPENQQKLFTGRLAMGLPPVAE